MLISTNFSVILLLARIKDAIISIHIFEPRLLIVLASTAKVKIKLENSVLITRSDIVVLRKNKESGRDGEPGVPAPKRVEGVSKPKQDNARRE